MASKILQKIRFNNSVKTDKEDIDEIRELIGYADLRKIRSERIKFGLRIRKEKINKLNRANSK